MMNRRRDSRTVPKWTTSCLLLAAAGAALMTMGAVPAPGTAARIAVQTDRGGLRLAVGPRGTLQFSDTGSRLRLTGARFHWRPAATIGKQSGESACVARVREATVDQLVVALTRKGMDGKVAALGTVIVRPIVKKGSDAVLDFEWSGTGGGTLSIEGPLPRTPDWLPARLQPEPGAGAAQFTLGHAGSGRCTALFFPKTDTAVTVSPALFTQQTDASGLSTFQVFFNDANRARFGLRRDVYRHDRNIPFYQAMDWSRFPEPACGWCSWYYYYQNINEEEIVKNAQWMGRVLRPFGAKYVQIDDGWQGRGHGSGDNRDWDTIDKRFPHGMKWLADQIHAAGLKAGLWLIPQTQSADDFVKSHASAFVWRENGTSAGIRPDKKGKFTKITWQGKFLLDPTAPEGERILRDLMTRLATGCGYDYFKIDGQPTLNGYYREFAKRLHDPGIGGDAAYRRSLKIIRDTIGPDRFLLGCYGIPTGGIGYMDGSRTGGDVRTSWAGIRPAYACTQRWTFLNNIAWHCDPDVVCVRAPLTLDEARTWATLVAMTGQVFMTSDRMYSLPDDRAEILKRCFPALPVRPVDLYSLKRRQMDLFDLRITRPFAAWDVVAVFNWGDTPAQRAVKPGALGWRSAGKGGRYVAYDFWEKTFIPPFRKSLLLPVRSHACRLLAVHRLADNPQLLSTSRHFSQGAVDLRKLEWDSKNLTLSGESDLVAGDPYQLRIAAPPEPVQYTAVGVTTQPRRKAVVTQKGPWVTVDIPAAGGGRVHWAVVFRQGPAAKSAGVAAPHGLRATAVDFHTVRVAWQPAAGAAAYRLRRDGVVVGTLSATTFTDEALRPKTKCTYAVTAVGWNGAESAAMQVSVTTPPPPPPPPLPDSYLADLKPMRATIGWGKLHTDKSVEGHPLRIHGTTYRHGIGTHARSELLYAIPKGVRRFVAQVGVDDEISQKTAGSVRFSVFVDGKRLWRSGVLRGNQSPEYADIPLPKGGKVLRLLVDDGGDDINYDHADWANAGFVR